MYPSHQHKATLLSMPITVNRWIWPLSLALSLLAVPSQAQPQLSVSAKRPQTSTFKLATQSNSVSLMEDQVLRQINQQRQRYGLSALQLNPQLSQVARSHSQQMANPEFLRSY